MTATTLAIDIGGTKIRWGLVDSRDAVRVLATEPTPRAAEDVVDRLTAGSLRWRSQCPAIDRVGISATGQVGPAGDIVDATDIIRGWAGTNLGARLSAALGLPVAVINDGNAAALALRAVFPVGRLLLVTLGTGVGGGLVYEDNHYERGVTGRGGELGHTLFRYGGRRCRCGSRGCVEAYLSGPAILRRGNRLAGRRCSDLHALQDQDPARWTRLMDQIGEELAHVLTSWHRLFECDQYVLAGGVTHVAPFFWPSLTRTLRDIGRIKPERVTRSPMGDDAFLLGAARAAAEGARSAARPDE